MLSLSPSRKTEFTSNEQSRELLLEEMVTLGEGDVLTFDYPVDKPLDILINDKRKFNGQVATLGQRVGFAVEDTYAPHVARLAAQ